MTHGFEDNSYLLTKEVMTHGFEDNSNLLTKEVTRKHGESGITLTHQCSMPTIEERINAFIYSSASTANEFLKTTTQDRIDVRQASHDAGFHEDMAEFLRS